ncbi:CBS domain-containing protein [Staphylococcus pseudoxylosus]|uniref:CBS domain-containing protein n=1 Tax=Staphylococcus pseudoxylosus TaxID=2282419 RepID=UPI00398A7108
MKLLLHDVEENLTSLAPKMAETEVGFLPILQHTNYVGIITDGDIVVKGLANKQTKAGDIMTTNIVTANSEMTIKEAVSLMEEHHIYRLLVVDDYLIQGIVTLRDLGIDGDKQLVGKTVSEISKGQDNN